MPRPYPEFRTVIDRAIEDEAIPAVKTVRLMTARRLKALRASLRRWGYEVELARARGRWEDATIANQKAAAVRLEIATIREALRAGKEKQ